MIQFTDFQKLDIRVDQIIKINHLAAAKHTTHKLTLVSPDKDAPLGGRLY